MQALSQTTTDVLPPPCTDTDYQNCPKLQAGHDSPTKLDGPLSYSFASNADLLATLGSQAAVDDFKTRARSAAQDWASRSGAQISEAQAGQAGNVTISASSDPNIRAAGGLVAIDPSDSNRRTITFSDEYNGWSAEGKDSTFSHEWGHVIGLDDVGPDECPGVSTVMRQTSSNDQLVNGNSGAHPSLDRPTRPNDCDLNKGRNEQQPTMQFGGGGGGGGDAGSGTGGSTYYPPCTPYYWVYYESYDGGETWNLVDIEDAGCW